MPSRFHVKRRISGTVCGQPACIACLSGANLGAVMGQGFRTALILGGVAAVAAATAGGLVVIREINFAETRERCHLYGYEGHRRCLYEASRMKRDLWGRPLAALSGPATGISRGRADAVRRIIADWAMVPAYAVARRLRPGDNGFICGEAFFGWRSIAAREITYEPFVLTPEGHLVVFGVEERESKDALAIAYRLVAASGCVNPVGWYLDPPPA